MNARFLLTPVLLGSFLALAACSASPAESGDSTSSADTATCVTTQLIVATGFADELRGALAEGAASDPNSIEIAGGLKVVAGGASGYETLSTVLGVGSTMNLGPGGRGALRLGALGLEGPLGVESGNAAKAMFDAMITPGFDGKGAVVKHAGPLDCMKLDVPLSNRPSYSCTIDNLTAAAHGFEGTGTTLTFETGTVAALRDALKPEFATADGFAVPGGLSGTSRDGGPDHVTSVDGIETYATPEPTSTMTAHFGGWELDTQTSPGNAAKKVFDAMTRATEVHVPIRHATTRSSANDAIVCMRVVEKLDSYSCTIKRVIVEKIAEAAAATAGFCAAP